MNKLAAAAVLGAAALGASLAVPSSAFAVDWFSMPTAGAVPATGSASPSVVGQGGNSDVGSARVRFLNKNTNRVNDLDLASGKQAVGLPLSITMRRCVRDVQGVPGQDVAWLDIVDASGNVPVFSGWMFNFYPDVAGLENPRYDVRLLGCARTGPVVAAPIRKAPKDVPASVSAGDEEAPGGDPNFVPGVKADDGAPAASPPPAAAAPAPQGDDQDELHNMMDGGMPERSTDQ